MDWLWPLYQEHVHRVMCMEPGEPSQSELQTAFLRALGHSTATLFVMEPVGATIRFRGLGRWKLSDVPDLMTDPHRFISDGFGGGKYKVNFHDGHTFVGTHNFRTWGDERWRELPEVEFE